jgi:hypothetical protein
MRWAGSATTRHTIRDGSEGVAPRFRRRALRAAITTVVLAGLTAGTEATAGAATGRTATPDTVVRIPTPLVTLGVPADGRLNVLGLSGQVLGAATGPRDGLGPNQVDAGTGQRLWVFGLRWTTQPQQGHTVGVSALLLAGATDQIPVPLPASADRVGGGSSGPMYFRASVPAAAADVAVQLSADGFSQRFSLTHLAREGTQPTALYRDPTSWEQTVEQHAEIDLPTPDTDPDNSVPDAVLPIKLAATHLSAFDPADPASATAAGQAWLTVDLSSQVEDVDLGTAAYLDYQTAVTGAAVTLTLPGGAPMPATTFPGGPDTAGVGIFTDRFTFPVPATFTTGTLVVDPGPLQAVPDDEVGPMPDTVTPAMPATFAIDVPQLPFTPAPGAATHAAVIPAAASTSPKPPTSGPVAATTTSTGGSASTSTLALAALLVAALVIAGVILRRRHRPAPATPLPPPAPPPGGPPPPPAPHPRHRPAS